MISWLFGSSIIYDLVIIAVVALGVYICFKVPEARKIIMSVFVICFVAFSGYLGFQLNAYYNLQGGVYGYLQKIFNKEENFEQTEYGYSYKLNNIKLTTQDGNTYSATIELADKVNLEENKNYSLFVNDVQCYGTEMTTSYIAGGYTYQFLNNDREEVLVDTLYINIALNDFNTIIKISTNGGQTAVDYWYSYYSKKELLLEIKESQYLDQGKLQESPGNQDIKQECVITFMARGKVYCTQVVAKGSTLTLPIDPPSYFDGDFRRFLYWKDNKNKKYYGGETIENDLILTAEYSSSWDVELK